MEGNTTLLSITQVKKSFLVPGSAETLVVLEDINLDIKAGSLTAIIGPSGSGKSTLLQIMGALDRPSSGNVRFKGKEIDSFSDDNLALFRNREIGFVFQGHYLLPQLSILENVLLPTMAFSRRFPQHGAESRAKKLLKHMGLGSFENYLPGQISGGMRQRTALARALINKPAILLADEPTGSLDQASAASMAEILSSVHVDEGTALVVVTHSAILASRMQDVYRLENRKLIRE
ncbi:MAG: ABC transporter ATP-binding protein [Spirochaetaceae bacterium]|nr:MAG: ABC transporter ATP-binding protein [Spirochaetaceae bacterium]